MCTLKSDSYLRLERLNRYTKGIATCVNQCDVNRTQVSLPAVRVVFTGTLRFSRWWEMDMKATLSFFSFCSSFQEPLNGIDNNP